MQFRYHFPSLETIGDDADFRWSQVTDLRNLKTIGGGADFRWSQVTDLPSLKSVKETVYIHNSLLTVENFNNIKTQGICG